MPRRASERGLLIGWPVVWSVWFYGISFGFNANGRPILNAEGNKLFNLFRINMLQDFREQGCRIWCIFCGRLVSDFHLLWN